MLRHGGFLEATILDADLVNTGSRAKRAVDLVKAIMERENEGPKKKRASQQRPASEKILRILQRKGFADVTKCFVGLPVVGKMDASDATATSSSSQFMSSSSSSTLKGTTKFVEQTTREPSPEDPDAIYDVVSKVGRFWYTAVYENVITGRGEAPNRSMWNDKGLLRECAKKRTNFKMMICHARKPDAAAARIS